METAVARTVGERVRKLGHRLWFDGIPTNIASVIRQLGVTGVTTNPAIIAKELASGRQIDQIRKLADPAADPEEVLKRVTETVVRELAQAFAPIFESAGGNDGFVSIEVCPRLADDVSGTVAEARAMFRRIGCRNVMVKVPATGAGIEAGQALLAEGIPVNFTGIFSVDNYVDVANAWQRVRRAAPSVASFFVRRTGVELDKALDALIAAGGPAGDAARKLLGQGAILNAQWAYGEFLQLFYRRSVSEQQLLFASTSNADQRFSPFHYVEALIGPRCGNTVPPETLVLFAQDGAVEAELLRALEDAPIRLMLFEELGIDLEAICANLQRQFVASFAEAWDNAVKTVTDVMAKAS